MTIADISSRYWGDPADFIDELRHLRARLELEETRLKVQARRKKAHHIRKLTKLAKSGALKDKKR